MDIESGKIAYSVEFSFNYEVGSAASSEGQREKVMEFEKMLEA